MSAGLTLDLRNYRDWLKQVQTLDQTLDSLDRTVDRIATAMNRAESGFGDITSKTRTASSEVKQATSALDSLDKELKDTSSGASSAASGMNKVANAADDMGSEVSQASSDAKGGFGGFMDKVIAGAPMMAAAFAAIVAAAATMAAGIAVESSKAYIEWESAFAGVVKTVDATPAQLAELEDQFRSMATDASNPVAGLENAAVRLAQIGEQAGQLGVPIENIREFAETIAMLEMSAPSLGQDAAMNLAQFANIMKMPLEDIDKLGSMIVNLGNNTATTEGTIVEFMQRLAGAGQSAGLTIDQVGGLAAAMASVGLNPEAGGTSASELLRVMTASVGSLEVKTVSAAAQKAGAESKLNDLYAEQALALRDIEEAQDKINRITDKTMLETKNNRFDELAESQATLEEINAEIAKLEGGITKGFSDKTIMEAGESLHIFSEIAGMTAQEFRAAWDEDPMIAVNSFMEGFSKLDQYSKLDILEDLELDGARVTDMINRLTSDTAVLNNAMGVATEGYGDFNYNLKEANARLDTTEAQINVAKNKFKELGYTIGEALNPYLRESLELFNNLLGAGIVELNSFFGSIGLIEVTPEATAATAEMGGQNTLLQERADIMAQIKARQDELGVSGGGLDSYIVKAGDNLSAIAAQFGTTVQAIMDANPEITNSNFIRAGDEITIPVAVTGDEQLENLNNQLTSNAFAIKQNRDEMRYFADETSVATEKVSPFQEKIARLQESFMRLSTPIRNAVSEAIGELITSLQAIPPEDVENMKTLAEAIGLFIAVFVGIPVAIAGVTALASALFALNFAANAVQPTVDILSGLGEVLQGIKEGDPEKIANGVKQIVEGWGNLNVAAVEALGEMGITIVQFFADIAGIDVNVAERVNQALHSFDLLAPIIENIQARVELGFSNFKQSIIYGINDILEAFNSLINSAPDFVLKAAGIEAGEGAVSLLDTSAVDAAVAQDQLNFDLLTGANQATMLENAKTEGGGYSQAYLDGVIEKLKDPTLSESVRSTLIGVLKSAFDGEGFSVQNELSSEQLFGDGLAATLKGLNVKLSTEEGGALDTSEIEAQVQDLITDGSWRLTDEQIVFAVNAKLQLDALQGETPVLTDEDAALLAGIDLTQYLPDTAPLMTAGEDYGLNLQTGLQQGIEANSQVATDAATTAGNDVITAYGNALGVQSPSTLTMNDGMMLNEGLALGILANQGVIGAAIATVLMQFSQIDARSAQTAAATRGNFAAMGAGIQGLAGTVAGASGSIVSHLNNIQSAAANALATLNQLATQAGVPISVAGASVVGGIEQRAEGGLINAGQVYNVAERSTGGVELFQAPDGLYMISAQSGTIIPPQTMPQQTFYNQSSGSFVFSPNITIGANAGVTEGQVRGILWDSLSEMQRLMEPSEMAFERAGF